MDNRIERQRDARIYIVSILFFLCIISGGILLCLYIFLPESQSADWYPIAGMVLVAIPWAFWFLTCIYRCFKPKQQPPHHHHHQFMDATNRFSKASSSSHTDTTTTTTTPSTVPHVILPDSSTKAESLAHSPGGGERRVHFGAVIVMDNQLQGQKAPDHHENDDVEKGQPRGRGRDDEANASESESESEMPLRLSV